MEIYEKYIKVRVFDLRVIDRKYEKRYKKSIIKDYRLIIVFKANYHSFESGNKKV